VYKTAWISKKDISRKWFLVDAKDQILGRVASKVANLLLGKHKTNYVPNMDCGDAVVLINSDAIKLTRGKEKKKLYYKHSGFVGHLKTTRFDEMMKRDSRKVIELAVKRMLPDTKLRATMMNRLYVYKGEEHEQAAQQPEEYKL